MLRDPTFRRVDASQDFRPQTMTYDPDKHHRRSIRLKNYDYGQPGTYYVTICTARRRCLFGRIENEKMHSSPSGEIVQEEWLRSAEMRSRVALDAFVIMPNHLHGIILLSDFDGASESVAAAETRRVTLQRDPTPDDEAPQRDATFEQFGKPTSDTIPTIVRLFKSAATKRINLSRGTSGSPVWQRNYYEHVVRDQEDLNRIRQYIAANLSRWNDDIENPRNRR